MNYPEKLKKGDTIGICAPSGGIVDPIKIKKLEYAEKALEELGYKVIETAHVRCESKARSSDSKTRAEEFMELYENPDVKLILFASGGEFLCEIYDFLDLEKIKSLPPKWTQGYSDCTGISFIFNTVLEVPAMYCQTIKDYAMKPLHKSLVDALDLMQGYYVIQKSFDMHEKAWSFEEIEQASDSKTEDSEDNVELTEKEIEEECKKGYDAIEKVEWKSLYGSSEVNMRGRALGGCLDVIREYIGTKYDNVKEYLEKYKTDGFIWFLECFEFSTPELFRTLWQMKNAGYFKYCRGIIFGRSLIMKEKYDISFEETLLDVFKEYGEMPILYDADIGHVSPQLAIVNGGILEISYSDGKATIQTEIYE